MRMRAFVAILFWLTAVYHVGADDVIGRPLSPELAPDRMSVPSGFQVTTFAAEPDVVQPIAFTFDDRGRMWVVECLSYPDWVTDKATGPDRIIILEDTDGDGRHDRKVVFLDNGRNYTGIAYGHGGLWVTATPQLLFIPDANRDDVPDSEPQVVLDGWDLKAKHNVFNGLTWGPDGWLYGCNGILSNSQVGPPGTPSEARVPFNCGVWRLHPQRRTFEPVAWGTTNPWGLDFDDYGQMFITNCVIKHLFHVIPGGHYRRMFGQDLNPRTYELMSSCADHIHWGGGKWQSSRGGQGIHDKPGGGHAHSGAMIYLGDNWPPFMRNRLFTCNLHGNRVNCDTLKPTGSGYTASHADDFLIANDSWFRGLELKYGPDGAVFVTDWSDTGECHDYDHCDRKHGRIYKVSYGRPAAVKVDLNQLTNLELVPLQLRRNEWFVRHSRRILAERAGRGDVGSPVHTALWDILKKHPETPRRLRALWALWVTAGIDQQQLVELLKDRDQHVRSWSIRLLCDTANKDPRALMKFAQIARSDESPLVRVTLASVLQRIPLNDRWPIVESLVSHADDADDANIPLMIWYGLEPLVTADRSRALQLAVKTKIPLLRRLIARRVAD